MNTQTETKTAAGIHGKLAAAGSVGLIAIALVAYHLNAATAVNPTAQPLNYLGSPGLNTYSLAGGKAVAYLPWFENGTWQGDLLAKPIDSNGVLSPTATWSARAVFADPAGANANSVASLWWRDQRIVFTTNGGSAGWTGNRPNSNGQLPFRFNDGSAPAGTALTTAQQATIAPNAAAQQKIVNFVRGDRSNEQISAAQATPSLPANPAGTLRERYSVLGDIIHSTSKYVGAPNFAYSFDGYGTFRSDYAGRAPRVYVGANDGMLHAFDAENGQEMFAYVPSMVISNLGKLAEINYVHTYYVDGELTTGDAYGNFATCSTAPCWRSVLVGGLGAGGKGFYALDITDPAKFDTEANAKANVLWEVGAPGNTADPDLGYTFSQPTITRLSDGKWVVVAGNGYDSTNGRAVLYLIDVATGAVTKIDTGEGGMGNMNGLSSPAVYDLDGDYAADVAYAGDLNGNLWRFNLHTKTFYKLYAGSDSQPITARPDGTDHPGGGFMVYFGTGRAFNNTDVADKTVQAIYGIRDKGAAIASPKLVTQTLTAKTYGTTPVRTSTTNAVDYASQDGWKVELPAGERLLGHIQVRGQRVQFTTTNTATTVYENWLTQLNYLTGGAHPVPVFDMNKDSLLNTLDNVGGTEVVTAKRLSDGVTPVQLVSQPVIGFLSGGRDVIILMYEGLPPAKEPCTINCTGGFIGGHIDVDTDSPSGGKRTGTGDGLGGNTDGHVHEYDKKHCAVYVDYFSLEPNSTNHTTAGPDCGNGQSGTVGLNRVTEVYKKGTTVAPFAKNQMFLVLLANADLSPGGKITIGDKTYKVKEYQDALISKIENDGLTKADLHSLDELLGLTLDGNKPTVRNETIPGALRISFNEASIITGGLIGTNTSCVRDGSGSFFFNNRWRNGALTIQLMAVDKGTDDYATSLLNVKNQVYIQPDDPTTAANEKTGVVLKYVISGGKVIGAPGSNDIFLYESTLFWHWDKDQDAVGIIEEALGIGTQVASTPCYGQAGWEAARAQFSDTLTAEQIQQAEDLVAKLKASGAKKDKTLAAKLEDALKRIPRDGGGFGGGETPVPVNPSGSGLSESTLGTEIRTGPGSWYDVGLY